ncbi:hypothetical protein QJS10_CPB14g00346 [Acorus calamus]|uniref:MULE transposase domain-containing protein n=1 Tax=Acorus calamus TaxID=4465 RepID=A0AAV9DAT5_ACOCL|nr:hypothetical protein QJS10_CPB14g00346 [Acorus calamus]
MQRSGDRSIRGKVLQILHPALQWAIWEGRNDALLHGSIVSAHGIWENAKAFIAAWGCFYGGASSIPVLQDFILISTQGLFWSHIVLDYKQVWGAKEKALAELRGSWEGSFSDIPAYYKELERTNPGVYTVLEMRGTIFPRFMWSFSQSITVFKYTCRPIIGVDGTHLKGADGEDEILPLAFAVVEVECNATWEWFFHESSTHIIGPIPGLVINSDRHPGLLHSIPLHFPDAYHGFCLRHMSENLKKACEDHVSESLFWTLARAFSPMKFDEVMRNIRLQSEDVYKWINNVPKEHWARVHFPVNRYELDTTNICESVNALLLEARSLSIVSLIEAVRTRSLIKFYKRFQKIRKKQQDFK